MENYIFKKYSVNNYFELAKNAKFKALLKRIAKENKSNLLGYTIDNNNVAIILTHLIYTIEFTEKNWKPLKSQLIYFLTSKN